MARTAMLITLLSCLAGVGITAPALADRAFTVRYSVNAQGDVTGTGNSLLTCRTVDLGCPAARNGTGTQLNNNDRFMTYVDVDGDASTFNSSSAALRLPAGAVVLFAGLYFGGRDEAGAGLGAQPAPNRAARDQVLLRPPGATVYQRLTAPNGVDQALDNTGQPREYQGFVDVTSIVRAGGPGRYAVANVQLGTGQHADQAGGWAIGVVYRDSRLPTRNLTIFDGLRFVTAGGTPVDITLSGFQTPKSGTVHSRVGLIAYEGDLGTVDDFAELDGKRLNNAANPATNFFNSSISNLGTFYDDRDPAYRNGFGYDADILDADGILTNGQTSARLHLSTTGDGYAPGGVSFATDLYAPSMELGKTVDKPDAQAGDVLTYEVSAKNVGLDAAVNTSLVDPLPAGTTFLPGSLEVVGGANAGPKTDAPGDDQAEYDPAAQGVVFRLGTGANAAAGGRLAVGESTTVRFKVTVDGGLPAGTVLTNRGRVSFRADTLGVSSTADTPEATTKVHVPDLTMTKSHGSGTLRAGADVTFSLVVRNIGDAPTRGAVTVTDTLSPHFSLAGPVAGPGWTCSTTGQTLTCSRDDALAAGDSWPAISVPVHIAADTPAGDIINIARVDGGGESDTSNNTGIDAVEAYVDLALDKVADAGVVRAGEPASFTITVRNLGRARATEVRVSDLVPNGLTLLKLTSSRGSCQGATCHLGTLDSGASATLHLLTVAGAGTGGRTLVNRARVAGAEREPVLTNNRDSASVQVLSAVDLGVTKTTAATSVPAGGDVSYVLAVSNRGPSDATGVVVTDTLPPGLTLKSATPSQGSCTGLTCNLGDLAAGASAQVLVTATSDPSVAGQTLTNTAVVTSAETDLNPGDNRATADVTFTADPPPAPSNVDVTKTASATTVTVGKPVTYTITATNAGPGAAADVVVIDTPDGPVLVSSVVPSQGTCTTDLPITCHLGALAPGAAATVSIELIPLAAGALSNGVSAISPTEGDTGGAGIRVDPPAPAVVIAKRALRRVVLSGGLVPYVIRVRSTGDAVARDLRICDALPAGMSFVRLGGATLSNGQACWTIAALAPGSTKQLAIVARAASVPTARRVTNRVTVSGAGITTRRAFAHVRVLPRPARGGGVTG